MSYGISAPEPEPRLVAGHALAEASSTVLSLAPGVQCVGQTIAAMALRETTMNVVTHRVGQLCDALGRLWCMSPKTVFQFLRKAAEPMPRVVVTSSAFGSLCGFENDFIYRSALANGSHEPHFDQIVEQLVGDDAVVLDVGANIGTHSIRLSRKVCRGTVHAFEPQSLVFSILQKNLQLHRCDNVRPYRFAVAELDNAVLAMEPFSFSAKAINNGGLRVDRRGGGAGDLVLSQRLDSFAFPRVDFIKMDIQGSEVDALRGAVDLLRRTRPVLYVEIEEVHLKALGSSSKELIEMLFGMGYALYRIQTEYPNDHLCIPIERADDFERTKAGCFSFTLSPRIWGKTVTLTFAHNSADVYQTVEVSH